IGTPGPRRRMATMSTKRTRIRRPQRAKITPEAIESFRRLLALEQACTCAHLPDSIRCSACKEWSAEHSRLHDLLGLKPWQWPAIEHPAYEDEIGSDGKPIDLSEAHRRYRMLERAAATAASR